MEHQIQRTISSTHDLFVDGHWFIEKKLTEDQNIPNRKSKLQMAHEIAISLTEQRKYVSDQLRNPTLGQAQESTGFISSLKNLIKFW